MLSPSFAGGVRELVVSGPMSASDTARALAYEAVPQEPDSPYTPLRAAAMSDPFDDAFEAEGYAEPAPTPHRAMLLRVLHLCTGALLGTLLRAAFVNFFSCYHRGKSTGDACQVRSRRTFCRRLVL